MDSSFQMGSLLSGINPKPRVSGILIFIHGKGGFLEKTYGWGRSFERGKCQVAGGNAPGSGQESTPHWRRHKVRSLRFRLRVCAGLLEVFCPNGNVLIDNLAPERGIRPFAVGRKNGKQFDAVYGTTASAVVYSIVETVKANKLNVYEYFRLLFPVILEHTSDTKSDFMENLLP